MKTTVKMLENGNIQVQLSIAFRIRGGRKRMIIDGGVDNRNEPLALTIARGYMWQKYIDEGKFANTKELARHIGRDSGLIARTIRISQLSPKIVHAILAGTFPSEISSRFLRSEIPIIWSNQESKFLTTN